MIMPARDGAFGQGIDEDERSRGAVLRIGIAEQGKVRREDDPADFVQGQAPAGIRWSVLTFTL